MGSSPSITRPVHPESYAVVERMATSLNVNTSQLVGNVSLASRLKAEDFATGDVGLPTVRDILSELAKPGRDPRNEFKIATFADDVHELEDLREGNGPGRRG